MSVIQTIFDNLAAVSVSITTYDPDKTPSVFNIDDLPASISTAQLPCRLLLLYFGRAEGRPLTYKAITGTTGTILWRITDLMLLRPVGQGTILQHSPHIVNYMANYITAMFSNRKIHAKASIEDVAFEPATDWAYPEGGATAYFGVQAVLSIIERYP